MKIVVLSIAVALVAGVAMPRVAASQGLELTRVFGGPTRDPVVVGDTVYVPGGRSVSAWNYADPAAPAFLGEADLPAGGIVTGLARWGDYLYASWYDANDAGVAVWSIADRARPTLSSQFRDYVVDPYKRLWSVATTGGYLYLFDQENGIFRANLAPDPILPTGFVGLPSPALGVDYDRVVVHDDWMYLSGSVSFIGQPTYLCGIYDVSSPNAPVPVDGDCGAGPYPAFFRTRVQPPYAATFGLENFVLTDLSNPAQPTRLGSTAAMTAMDGFLHGGYAYGLGWIGIDVLDVRDPAQPTSVAHSPVSLLGVASTTPTADGAFVTTLTDRLVRLDVATDPLAPRVVSDVSTPGGAYAVDVAPLGDKVVFLAAGYGLGVADARTLAPLARFDADLPEHLAARRMSDLVLDGDYAYVASAGYGLLFVDLSNPLAPVERARIEMAGGDFGGGNLHVALSGDTLFALRTMFQGSYLQAVDVSNPASPVVRHTIGVGGANRIAAHGKFLYVAGDDGLAVYDVRVPTNLVPVGHWLGCDGIAPDTHPVKDVALSADGRLAYVACVDRLVVVDLADPANPQHVGEYVLKNGWQSGASVAVRGDRAWYGDGLGVHEIDVANPSAPTFVRVTGLADMTPSRLRPLPDGRVFAFTPLSGIHVFGAYRADVIYRDGFEG